MTGNLLSGDCHGRTISADGGTSVCPDCNTSNVNYNGIERIVFKCEVSRDQASDAVRHWWQNRLIASNLEAEGKIDECHLQYVPFWKLTASVDIGLEGYRIYSDDYSDTKIPMNYHLDNFLTWTGVACEASDAGIEFLRNLAGETVPYEECPESACIANISKNDAEVKFRKATDKYILDEAKIPHITSEHRKISLLTAVLLFYPLWIIRYVYSGHKYSATVDGVTGQLLAGLAPGDLAQRNKALASGLIASILLVAANVLTLFIGLYIAYLSKDACCCSAGIIGILLLILDIATFDFVSGMFGHLRYGVLIAGGDAKEGYMPVKDSNNRGFYFALECVFVGFVSIVAGIVAIFYFIGRGWSILIPVHVIAFGLAVYLVSCWHSYDNKRKIKGEVQVGLCP